MTNYKSIRNDLFYFLGDDSETAPPLKIFRILAYKLQSFETKEEVFHYLESVIKFEAINLKLITNGDSAGILRFFNKIEYFLRKVEFIGKKELLKTEILSHLKEIDNAFLQNICDEVETSIYLKYLEMHKDINSESEPKDTNTVKEKKFYSIKEVAEMYMVTPQTVYNWIKEGRIRTVRISEKRQRISIEEIDGFNSDMVIISK